MQDFKSLKEYFNAEIQPFIPALQREYELFFLQKKRSILIKMNWGLVALIGLAATLRLLYPSILPSNMIGLSVVILIVYLLVKYLFLDAWIKNTEEAKVFTLKFKQKMVLPILQIFDDSLQLFPDARIDTDTLYKSGLFYPMKRTEIKGEDLVKGQYKGMDVRFSEMSMVKRQSGKESENITIFKGLFMETTLPTSLEGVVFVLPKSAFKGKTELFKMKILPSSDMTAEERKAYNMKIAMTAMSGYRWSPDNVEMEVNLKEVSIEDKVVSESFKVFANETSAAYKLLNDNGLKEYLFTYQEDESAMKAVTETASFRVIDNAVMERLKQTHFCISVVNDKAYLAVPFMNKNLFDPDWSDGFLSYENVEIMYEELNSVFNFLDIFTNRGEK